jgi:hypothetical protein
MAGKPRSEESLLPPFKKIKIKDLRNNNGGTSRGGDDLLAW